MRGEENLDVFGYFLQQCQKVMNPVRSAEWDLDEYDICPGRKVQRLEELFMIKLLVMNPVRSAEWDLDEYDVCPGPKVQRLEELFMIKLLVMNPARSAEWDLDEYDVCPGRKVRRLEDIIKYKITNCITLLFSNNQNHDR
jgi:hypothetical protein